MKDDDSKYNGWTNYETWNVALWLGNEEGSSRYWASEAQSCYDTARDTPSANARLTGHEPFTHAERATLALMRQLKAEIEEGAPDLGASMWSDLLSAAMSEVNWYEIAASLIDEVDTNAVESDDMTEADDRA